MTNPNDELIRTALEDAERIESLIKTGKSRATISSVMKLRSHVRKLAHALTIKDRSATIVLELASMTDTEADFLDGSEIRDVCRAIVNGEAATVPRLYSDEERQRAARVLSTDSAVPISGFTMEEVLETVDQIAEALGMRRAGT